MTQILVTHDHGKAFQDYEPRNIKMSVLSVYKFLVDRGKSDQQIPDAELDEIIKRVGTQVESLSVELGTGDRKVITSGDLHFLVAFQLMKSRFKEVAYWYTKKVGNE